MNKEIIRDELRWLLEAINEQFEGIKQYDDKVPQIELDILMENVRKLYESMRVLQRMNEFVPLAPGKPERRASASADPAPASDRDSVESAVTIRFDKPADTGETPVSSPAPAAVPAVPVVPVPSAPADPGSEPVMAEPQLLNLAEPDPDPVPPPAPLFRPVAREPRREPAPRKAAAPPAMDLFAGEDPAFSIRLKEAREKSLGPKIPSERITNLKAAITINDKFMFINELFEGNLREYNETIETLNGFRTLDEAAGFLDLVKRKNFWDTASEAFRKLKELVERRF